MRRWIGRAFVLSVATLAALWGGRMHIIEPIDDQIDTLRRWRPLTQIDVLDRNGEPIDSFAVERRQWRPLDEMTPRVWQALVSAEDRRFLDHPGVDLQGIARAMWVNFQADRIEEGGSTITQQIVKNLIVGDEGSYRRKLAEALVAWRLEGTLSKAELLELYANCIYLGDGNYGIEAASVSYFGVHADELTAAEAALLAGLIPAPTAYSPRHAPETSLKRRDLVLGAMAEEGYLSAEEAEIARATPLRLASVDTVDRDGREAYLTRVRREVRDHYEGLRAYELGLKVYTAFDPAVQEVAEAATADAVDAVMARQGVAGARRRLGREDVERFLALAPETYPDREPVDVLSAGDCFETAYVGDRTFQRASQRFTLDGDRWWQKVRASDDDTPSKPLAQAARWGEVYVLCLDEAGEPMLDPTPWLDSAAVVIENATGSIVAMSGGIDAQLEGFNKATQARRQPGSSFKPYVYSAALLSGRSATDKVLDGPLALPGGSGRTWRPQNYGGGYMGWLPLRSALAASLNTVSVRLALEVGVDPIRELAHDLGVETPVHGNLTLALGSGEVTPLDQAAGYSSLARMGVAITPSTIQRVEARSAQITANDELVAGVLTPSSALPPRVARRVMSAGVAREMVGMMEGVVRWGTGRRAHTDAQARAGKTGTTNGNVDAWFVGFTPTHTVAVWVGADRRGLGDRETGGRTALPAWIAIVESLPTEGTAAFPMPDEAMWVTHRGESIPIARQHHEDATLARGPAPLPAFPGSQP